MKELCANLQRQPLLHLSLHSKELFHSNFLGWLCEAHPDAAAKAMEPWVPARATRQLGVWRERDHLDLAVQLPGRAPFIVENKVFSAPDEAQLEGYVAGNLAGFDEPTLLLLSLGAPTWPDGTFETSTGHRWRHVSFADLDVILGRTLEALADAPVFHTMLIEQYRTLVVSLERLAVAAGRPGPAEAIEVPVSVIEELRGVRLHDAIGKLRARSAISAARAYTQPQLGDVLIDWQANFTNASPLTAAFVKKESGDWIGWQYQHGQWRLAVITHQLKGRGEELRERRAAFVAERYASWFDFEAVASLIGRDISVVPPREAAGGFNHYAPDFVYRYRKLPALTQEELIKLSHHYLSAAAAWRPKAG